MKKAFYFLVLFFLVSFQGRQNLMIDNNFDGENPFAGFSLAEHQYCCSYSLTAVNNPSGSGNVIRYELHSTDRIVSSSVRSEFQLPANMDAPETSERWYGLRYLLEKYDADAGAESILQWHDKDGSSPPLSIQVQNGRMNVCQSFSSGNLHYDIGPTVTGKWFSIVMHVKWTMGNTGLLEVWKDGIKLVNKPNVRTNSSGGSYMKIGINKWSWAPGGGSSSVTERLFYIDDFRMGNERSSYNDVAPDQLIVTPLKWDKFSFDDTNKTLNWNTLSEQNVKYFFIEKSTDNGKTWQRIAVVPSKSVDGNSTELLTYQYKL
jgi:hypothetical protein